VILLDASGPEVRQLHSRIRMRAHALVLLVVLALVSPALPAAGEQSSADAAWDRGHQLVRLGNYAAAQDFYAQLADQFGPAVAPRARLLQARAALADGDTDTAETDVQQLLNDYPSSDQVAPAYFTLEQVRRAAGDCDGALRALDAFEAVVGRTAIGPYTALQRAQCAFKLGDWQGELQAAGAALAIDGGGPRLTRIEALERSGEAELKLGRPQEAFDFYNRSLELAATPAYKAEMLYTTATLGRSLGQDALAADRFRAVVVDYSDQARAPGALDALEDMGRDGSVSPLQAGLVRLHAADWSAAIEQFDQVDFENPDWGTAQLNRVEALLKLGKDDEAAQWLTAVAQNDTTTAGSALLRLGQVQERDGDEASAEASYLRMADAAPDRTAEALYHVGFTRFVRGDGSGALSAWHAGSTSGPPSPTLQAQLLYWTARVLPGGSSEAQQAYTAAASAAPESFYGLRAQEKLGLAIGIASSTPATGAAWQTLSSSEVQERTAWLARLGTTPERVAADLGRLPALSRADALLELGLRTEAGWEADGVAQQYAQTKDVAHLSALVDWLTARELPQLGLRVGRQLRDLVGFETLPRAVQKQAYPAAWGDLVGEDAAQYRVDPLLVLALMRQESSFDPRAQSGAQAMGLMQIVGPTARGIAAKLGRDDFESKDLFKPSVSVEFGTWFLAQLMGTYRGQVFPALAAYNAGEGNATRWWRGAANDPDVMIEEIPFVETQNYVRIVFDNYWHYRALYGAQ
jgi:soluble lytic murein transglycosylase